MENKEEFEIVIAACARWESDYIAEWLNYHRILGFNHVFLYCNDDDPADLYERTLPFTFGRYPFVTFIHYPFQGMQGQMYKHFLKHHAHRTKWFIFLDIDEFLVIKSSKNLISFINSYDDCDALYINWVFFGNSGFVERAPGSVLLQYIRRDAHIHPFTKILTRRASLNIDKVLAEGQTGFWHNWQQNVREEMRLRNVLRDDMSHYYDQDLTSGRSYLGQGDRETRIFNTALIHHYAFKSESDLERRFKRGLGGDFFGQQSFKNVHDQGTVKAFLAPFNEVEDRTLSDFWNVVRSASREAGLAVIPAAAGYLLSVGKPAAQSSISPWSLGDSLESDARRAVSGIFTGRFNFHTNIEDAPWWQVDLLDPCLVCQVRLYNRMDSEHIMRRSVDLAIKTSFDGQEWTTVFTKTDSIIFGGVDGSPLIWTPIAPALARYVRIQLLKRDFLHLDQVEVWGDPDPFKVGSHRLSGTPCASQASATKQPAVTHVLAFGSSHLAALERAAVERPLRNLQLDFLNLSRERYQPLFSFGAGEITINSHIIEDLLPLIEKLQPRALAATIGGAEHFAHGAIRNPKPFDFVLPHSPALPLDDGVEILPYDLVLLDLTAQMRSRWKLFSELRKLTALPVLYLCPPPPVRSSETIEAELPEAWREDAARLGIPSPWTRYRLWYAFTEAAKTVSNEVGIEWMNVPSESHDADGFLLEAYRRDAFHGNARYGDAVLRNIAAHLEQESKL